MITDIIDRIRLLFVTEKRPFLELKEILGFYPHDIRLYRLALVHKSVAHFEREKFIALKRNGKGLPEGKNAGKKKNDGFFRAMTVNNERLEYLGDAMLSAIVADILYKHYGNKQEGFLTSLRSKIVCRRSLNKLAVDLGLDKLILHTGAVTTGHNSYMGGNAFEAFFGAIYLDRGFDYSYRFLEEKVFARHIDIEKMAVTEENHKSKIIEWCQRYKFQFQFVQQEIRLKENKGTPIFKSAVLIEGIKYGDGEGYTKKEADQIAAKHCLSKVKGNKAIIESIKAASLQRMNNAHLDAARCE